jgi:hypothetical protein
MSATDVTGACELWHGAKTPEGYGVRRYRGRQVYAHRLVWEQTHGPIQPGLVIDHLCRNPACVNPDHLEPVTNAVNAQRGTLAKLTRPQVDEIRRRVEAGEARRILADEFGVTKSAIKHIVKGRTWRP